MLPDITPIIRQEIAARARAVKSEREAARRLQRVDLASGVYVYPDNPPGIGWVLVEAGRDKRYYATKDMAIAQYRSKQ